MMASFIKLSPIPPAKSTNLLIHIPLSLLFSVTTPEQMSHLIEGNFSHPRPGKQYLLLPQRLSFLIPSFSACVISFSFSVGPLLSNTNIFYKQSKTKTLWTLTFPTSGSSISLTTPQQNLTDVFTNLLPFCASPSCPPAPSFWLLVSSDHVSRSNRHFSVLLFAPSAVHNPVC